MFIRFPPQVHGWWYCWDQHTRRISLGSFPKSLIRNGIEYNVVLISRGVLNHRPRDESLTKVRSGKQCRRLS